MGITIPAPRLFVIVAAAALSLPLSAQDSGAYRLEPDSQVQALSAALPEAGPETLLATGILFSGATASRAQRAAELAELALADAREIALAHVDPYERGQAILDYLHSAWLRRYVETDTTLDAALIDGRYNCVSSSVLYLALAGAAGLQARGVVTPDHAFCAILAGDRWVDVETTNRHGFDPGAKKEFLDSFGRVTGYTYVPPTDTARRRDADRRHMLALILWNRANLLERSGRFSEALALSVDAYAWFPSDESLEHLAGRAHNVAAQYLNRRLWNDGIAFLETAILAYGGLGTLTDLLRQAKAARLADDIAAMDPDRAMAAVNEAWAGGALNAAEYESMYAYALSRKANELFKALAWQEAWQLVETARAARPGSADLARLAQAARANLVAAYHNAFAELYNAGRYQEALAEAQRGLAILPGDATLKRDEQLALQALSR